jgi:hypothetical protein
MGAAKANLVALAKRTEKVVEIDGVGKVLVRIPAIGDHLRADLSDNSPAYQTFVQVAISAFDAEDREPLFSPDKAGYEVYCSLPLPVAVALVSAVSDINVRFTESAGDGKKKAVSAKASKRRT